MRKSHSYVAEDTTHQKLRIMSAERGMPIGEQLTKLILREWDVFEKERQTN